MKNIYKIILVVIGILAILLFVAMLFVRQSRITINPPEEFIPPWYPFSLDSLNANQNNYLKIAGQTLQVDLAILPEAQEMGLSGRKSLNEKQGMLFVFYKPEIYNFWMKDMLFPIDIIWIREDKRVVYIKKNVLPDSYPETFSSDFPAQYVLEVSAGFSEKNNLKVGDRVEFLSS